MTSVAMGYIKQKTVTNRGNLTSPKNRRRVRKTGIRRSSNEIKRKCFAFRA